jgi:hypothetical protein
MQLPLAAVAAPLTPQEEATARFQTGLRYYDAQDFESARLAFTQAYAVLKRPGILLNLALSELYSDRPVEALEHLDVLLAEPDLAADDRAHAKKAYDTAFAKTGHIAVEAPAEAEVSIDGKRVLPRRPLVHVAPGAHEVEAKLGEETKRERVNARPGETTNVTLAFGVARDAPGGPFTTDPPADGSGRDGTFWGIRSIGGLSLVGLGAVALGVGLAFKIDQSTEGDRVTDLQARLPAPDACSGSVAAECAELRSAIDSRNDAGSRANTMFVVGSVAAGAGLALIVSSLVWPHKRAATTGGLTPILGARQVGLSFSSEF